MDKPWFAKTTRCNAAERTHFFCVENKPAHHLGARPASPDVTRFLFLLPTKSDALPSHTMCQLERRSVHRRGFFCLPQSRGDTQTCVGLPRQRTQTNEPNMVCRRGEMQHRRATGPHPFSKCATSNAGHTNSRFSMIAAKPQGVVDF